MNRESTGLALYIALMDTSTHTDVTLFELDKLKANKKLVHMYTLLLSKVLHGF